MPDKERTSPAPMPSNPIETADIWSDGAETASDRRIREFTLRELEKSRKVLPKERYEALVKAVGDILRAHYEREEEVHESVRTKIAEFKGEVAPKNEPGCLRHKFDPVMINGRETAEYLTDATSTPEKFEAFKRLIASDGELMAGFVRYWVLLDMRGEVSNNSNVKRIMTQNRGSDGVAKLNDFHRDTVDSLGIILNDETLNVRRGGSTERKNEGVADQLKLKFNFFPRENGKYYEREGNKVSKDFAAITGGASMSGFRNEEIADVFSYAYVHSNKQYPLANESGRVPDAISKIKARFAHDPAGLIAISEWWGELAKTKPSIDRRLQVGDAKGIKNEFITTAKEAFEEATMNIVDDFVKRQLGEGASSEKIAKVANEIQSVIEKTSADPQMNYFSVVGGKIQKILEKAGVKNLTDKDHLAFIRSVLEVDVASQRFDAKNDPKEAKYLEAFQNCKEAEDVEAVKTKLLKANPGDKDAIERHASLKMKALSTEALGLGMHFWGFKLGDAASTAVLKLKGSVTEWTVDKGMGRIMDSEKKRADVEKTAWPRKDGEKPYEDMTDDELRQTKASLDSKSPMTENDRKASLAVAAYIASRNPARREFVAIVNGTTYEEVAKREKNGESLESMFEKAKKEPTFKNADSRGATGGKDESPSESNASYGPGSIPRELRTGQSYEFKFSGDSAPVEVKKTADAQNPYVVSVDGKESFTCSEKNLRAHLDMVKLLCDNGIEFLAPVSREMLKAVSLREGNLGTAEDGNFSEREKRLMLKGFASAFEIDGFPTDSVESSRMETHLKTFATERATTFRDLGMRSKILDENGNVRNRETFLARLGK